MKLHQKHRRRGMSDVRAGVEGEQFEIQSHQRGIGSV